MERPGDRERTEWNSLARQNSLNALDALRRVFLGNPFVPVIDTS